MAKLGDICTIYSGTGFPVQYQGNPTGRYPFYKVGDIAKNVTQGFSELKICENYIDDDACHAIKGNIIPEKTIVFAKIGEAVKLNRRGITTVPCLIDNNAMGVKPNENIISLQFFYHFMCNLKLEDYAEATTVPSVKKTIVEKIEIPLPPLETQKQIAARLDKVTHTIDLCNAILEKLDLLVKSRFVEMFGEPVHNTKNWNTEVLSKHLNVVGGYAFKSDLFQESGIPVLRIGNINAGYFRPVNMVYWEDDSQLDRYKMYAGDLVMSLTGTVGKDDYGNVCILGNDYDVYYLNQRNAKLELLSSLDKYYLSELLKFEEIKKKFTGISRGVRQANISNKDILNLCVPIPPIDLQQQFAAFVEQIDKSKLAVKQVLEKAETLKKALMQEYFGN